MHTGIKRTLRISGFGTLKPICVASSLCMFSLRRDRLLYYEEV